MEPNVGPQGCAGLEFSDLPTSSGVSKLGTEAPLQTGNSVNHLVFVFGTLKEEFPNFRNNVGTRVPGTYETVNQYPLYLVGERHSPWMVNTPGSGEHVIGQVFRVDSNALARMDILERVREPDGYERILIKVRPWRGNPSHEDVDEDEDEVYAYLKNPRHLAGVEIKDGPFAEYSFAHSALYRSRGGQT